MNAPTHPAGRPSREQRVADAFVALADTLVADFDLAELLHQLTGYCQDLLQVDGAGVMLADQDGRIRLLASSDESTRLLELFEIDADQGPCLASLRSGDVVEHPNLASSDDRWKEFAARAHADGYRSAHAIPLRLREQTIGVLNLFSTAPGRLGEPEQKLGRALADAVTISLLQHRAIIEHRTLADQLQNAFTNRMDIERAKGILIARLGISADQAFETIRRQARSTNRKVGDLAHDINTGKALHDVHPPPAAG